MKESMEFPLGYGDDTTNLQTFQPLSYIPKYNSITQPLPHSAAATGKPAKGSVWIELIVAETENTLKTL